MFSPRSDAKDARNKADIRVRDAVILGHAPHNWWPEGEPPAPLQGVRRGAECEQKWLREAGFRNLRPAPRGAELDSRGIK